MLNNNKILNIFYMSGVPKDTYFFNASFWVNWFTFIVCLLFLFIYCSSKVSKMYYHHVACIFCVLEWDVIKTLNGAHAPHILNTSPKIFDYFLFETCIIRRFDTVPSSLIWWSWLKGIKINVFWRCCSRIK